MRRVAIRAYNSPFGYIEFSNETGSFDFNLTLSLSVHATGSSLSFDEDGIEVLELGDTRAVSIEIRLKKVDPRLPAVVKTGMKARLRASPETVRTPVFFTFGVVLP